VSGEPPLCALALLSALADVGHRSATLWALPRAHTLLKATSGNKPLWDLL
jgi:hypothetical protein